MKILFTGGGSGGHFYPLIAIAEELRRIANEERLISPQLFYMAPEAYDERLLFENEIAFLPVRTGKLRRYASVKNISDVFKIAWALMKALMLMFRIFPDVVVGKGGYGSFPALFAARLLRIPVIIHESDSIPGRVNKRAGTFARRIAVSFASAARFFPGERVAYTGNPIRKELRNPSQEGSREALHLEDNTSVVALLGGSLGSVKLNEALFAILPALLGKYEVIHQTGAQNFEDISARANVLLEKHPFASRYHPYPYLSVSLLARVASAASLIISRAGSTIFEIAAWGTPAILVPITDSGGDHQRENAYAYMQAGAALVIEEENLKPAILLSEIEKILENQTRYDNLARAAKRFAKLDAAEVIAREILEMALKHEK